MNYQVDKKFCLKLSHCLVSRYMKKIVIIIRSIDLYATRIYVYHKIIKLYSEVINDDDEK